MQAIVTGPAIVLEIIFPEIIEQQLAAALAGLCIGHRLIQELLANLLLRHGLPLHELLQLLDVLVAVIGDASAFLPVTARPAGFLVVAFYALGNVVMDDEAHVRLVNAHAEGDGGHNHVHLFHQEQVLVLRPGLGVQAGVVRERLDAVDGQQLGHLLHLLAAEAVDDAGLAGILTEEADDVFLRLHLVPYFIIKVGPIEGRLEHLGILDAEGLEDVALHLGRGRSREGDDGSQLDFLHDGADFPVLRTEIVAPLGDTVGFVHSVERYLDFPQKGDILFFRKGFRRHIQQFGDTPQQIFLDFLELLAAQGRIQEVGYPGVPRLEAPDGIHLVLHEGDEGRNHDSRSFHDKGGQLVAERLAAAGGHEHKGVVPFREVADDGFLVSLETIVTEESLQFFMQYDGIYSHERTGRFSVRV